MGDPLRALVTGAAGFIGSSLADRLLQNGYEVLAFDNFSTGQEEFIAGALLNPHYQLVRADLFDLDAVRSAMKGIDVVFHLAANADVRFGVDHPRRDLEQNTIVTWNVLEAMREAGVRRIAFSSTGSVYGEATMIPTPEDCPFPVQTSLYGASKVAAESLIQAYCEGFGMQACIFRFVSIMGERYTHGHVVDFYRQLLEHPGELLVLGNGTQRKSYLYVQDCLDAILMAMEQASAPVSIYNLGTNEYCEVNQSIQWICDHLGLKPALQYSGGNRGWIGDNPFIFLDCSRMRALGWQPRLTIQQAVIRTVEFLQSNQQILVAR
jgi:UDP-glucose 4-epimerase